MNDLQTMLDYAKSFLGVPYKFGGRNRLEGLDCSQFVIELLISRGILPHGYDNTAQGIFYDLLNNSSLSAISKAQLGALAFYGINSDSLIHVAFCIDDKTMIEAGGGTRQTLKLVDAVDRSACIRERPIRYRKDFYCCLMPNYDKA